MERFLAYPLGPAGRAYLASRGLLEAATDLRFGEVSSHPERRDHWRFRGRLVIPSFSARGTVTDLAFRCIEDHACDETVLWTDDSGKDQYCAKYLFVAGLEKRLYNVGAVQTTEPTIHIAEGQLDAATLVACGLPAVGVPGAQAWKPHAHRLFQGFERVVFWADADDKGASLTLFNKIRQSLRTAEMAHLPEGHDVNSLFVEGGRDAITGLVGAERYDGSTEVEDLDDDEGIADEGPEDRGDAGDAGGSGQGFGPAGTIRHDEHGDVIPF